MLKAALFVPADRKEFINKIKVIKADFIILDLEESVHITKLNQSINNILDIENKRDFAIRIPSQTDDVLLLDDLLDSLYAVGFRVFIIPKISCNSDLDYLIAFCERYTIDPPSLGVIIETPYSLLHVQDIVNICIRWLKYLFVGTHDFIANIGCDINSSLVHYLRDYILLVSRTYSIECVDMVSTELVNMDIFKQECLDAFRKGFDAKAVVSPSQITALYEVEYYSNADIIEAHDVVSAINDIGENEFSVVKVNGRMYETPHLKRIYRILEYEKRKKV